jgi:hypothetical protein
MIHVGNYYFHTTTSLSNHIPFTFVWNFPNWTCNLIGLFTHNVCNSTSRTMDLHKNLITAVITGNCDQLQNLLSDFESTHFGNLNQIT